MCTEPETTVKKIKVEAAAGMTERSTSTAKERAVMEMKTDEKKEDATTVTKMPQRDEVIGTIAGMDSR